jgi:hypothetical protein
MADYWKGEAYAQGSNILGGARLFILGEAHYHDEASVGTLIPNITIDVINLYLNDQLGSNATFFRRVERLVSKRFSQGLNRAERENFWHSVIFSNYIPVVVGNGPGERPTEELWNGSAGQEFIENVAKTEAEIVLVCGTELWRRKKFHHAVPAAYHVGQRAYEAHEIRWSEDWGAVAAHIPHPSGSRGWSYERCNSVINYLFASMNQRRAKIAVDPAIPSTWTKADRLSAVGTN